jgi:DNA-binding PadR family transcriptional regulator
LQELMRDGLVTCAPRGRRKMYEITPLGKERLEVALRHAEEAIKRLNRLLSL